MPNTHPRRLTLLILALILTVSILPGQRGAAQETTEIVIGTTDFPRSLDPASAYDYPSWELLAHLYTGLTRQVLGTLDYELALASDHTVSADGLTHTLIVRPDAAFDDGTPITAATFVRSINRVIALGRDGADLVNQYIAAADEGEGNTIRFTLRAPVPDFEALLALPAFFPQHPDVYPADDLLSNENATSFIGNGPYRLGSYQPRQAITLVANPDYAGTPPANSRVVLRFYELPIDLRRALLARDVDVAWRALSVSDLAAIADTPDIMIRQQPNLQVFYLLFNHQTGGCTLGFGQRAPFDNPAVRQAFALLVNRERGAVNGFENTVTPLYSLLPPQFSAAEATFPTPDLEQARTLLQDAGYLRLSRPLNAVLVVSSENYGDLMDDAGRELQRSIVEVSNSVNVNVADSETSPFIRGVYRGEFCSPIVGWRPTFPSPAEYLRPLAASEDGLASAHQYANAEVDTLLDAAARSADPDERNTLYRRAQTLLTKDYALIPLWQGQDTIAFYEDVSGVIVEANSWLRYDSLTRP